MPIHGMFGDTLNVNYDFKTKVAGSNSECPLRVLRANINPSSPALPVDLFYKELLQQQYIDRLKIQDSTTNVETAFNSVNTNILSTNAPVDGTMNVEIEGNTLKNELNYNPNTWAEWVVPTEDIPNITKDSTGITFTSPNNEVIYAALSANIKVSTKYGFLFNVVSVNAPTCPILFGGGSEGSKQFAGTSIPKVVGNNKLIVTSYANLGKNTYIQMSPGSPGETVKLKDIRVYELPAGSQIETDFNTLTADQLAVKYPFYSGIQSVGGYAGFQATNLIPNSNFVDSTGWNASSTTLAVANNEATVTIATLSSGGGIYVNSISPPVGNKIYCRAMCNVKYNNNVKIGFGDSKISTPVLNTNSYQLQSAIVTKATQTSLSFSIDTTTNYVVGDTFKIKEVMAIDLTAIFGAGKEPSQEWCDANLSYFATTTTTTDKIEVLSVGKNLFNQPYTVGKTFTPAGGLSTPTTPTDYKVTYGYTQIKPNTVYTVSPTWATGSVSHCFYDENYVFISSILANSTQSTGFTTPSNARYMRFTMRTDLGDTQLEYGTVATTYEPYKQDKIDILVTQPHRGFSNGVRDIISSSGVVTRKIGKVVLNGTEAWSNRIGDVTDDGINMIFSLNNHIVYKKPSVMISSTKTYSSVGVVDAYSKGEGFLYYNHTEISTSYSLYIVVAKSKLSTPDLTGFRAWLASNPVTVFYELVTPTVDNMSEKVIDGSLGWTNAPFSRTGFKTVWCDIANMKGDNHATLIKYNGSILNYDGTANAIDTFIDYGANHVSTPNKFLLCISNTDSGWGQDYTPTADEIKAYFYGWKMYDASTNPNGDGIYNRTDGLNKYWCYRLDGINPVYTAGTNVLPTTLATGFTPYKLYYQPTNSIDIPQLTLNSYAKGTLMIGSKIYPWIKETHTIGTDDSGIIQYSSATTGLVPAILIEVNLTPLCNVLSGGSNSAFKSLLKNVSTNIWAMGQGSNGGVLGYGTSIRYYDSTNNTWGTVTTSTANTVSKMTKELLTNINASTGVNSSNKIYILIHSTYPSDNAIPSVLDLDYIDMRVDLTRTPDVYDATKLPQFNVPYFHQVLIKGFSPAWDSNNALKTRMLWYLRKDADNYSQLLYDSSTKKFNYKKCVNGVITYLPSGIQSFNKWQCVNIICEQTNQGMTMRILKNGGTVEKVSNTNTNTWYGMAKLYLLTSTSSGYQADAFMDKIEIKDLSTRPSGYSDEECETMLKATYNMVDMGKTTLHSNATYDSGLNMITLNATVGWQNSYIDISVLPNNTYELSGSTNGIIVIDEYYNNILLKHDSTQSIIDTFTTQSNTNKVRIYLTSSGAGTFTFKDIQLKRKDD